MPEYLFRCDPHENKETVHLSYSQHDDPENHPVCAECGVTMRQVITRPASILVQSNIHFKAIATPGHEEITSRKKLREWMDSNDLVNVSDQKQRHKADIGKEPANIRNLRELKKQDPMVGVMRSRRPVVI